MAVTAVLVTIVVVVAVPEGRAGLVSRHLRLRCGSLDDLVQLAAIEPYASAGRTIIDLHALTIGHHQIHFLAHRTLQCLTPGDLGSSLGLQIKRGASQHPASSPAAHPGWKATDYRRFERICRPSTACRPGREGQSHRGAALPRPEDYAINRQARANSEEDDRLSGGPSVGNGGRVRSPPSTTRGPGGELSEIGAMDGHRLGEPVSPLRTKADRSSGSTRDVESRSRRPSPAVPSPTRERSSEKTYGHLR
jgi:hypothetical protein